MTEPDALQQVDRTFVSWRGRRLSYFSGCDYYRLASHPAVLKAAGAAARRFGLNVAASRLTTGNHSLYLELEKRLRSFFGAEDALVVSSGYLTDLVVAQALAGQFSHALLDERAHPALFDAARFLDCPVLRFKTQAPAAVQEAVRRCGPGSKLALLTDGMFSHDGSAAPLKEYLKVLPRDSLVVVDDAHGAGVLGNAGQGTLEWAGVPRHRVIQTVSFSKAFGAYGGAVLARRSFRELVVKRSQAFAGSTPLPLPLAGAVIESIGILTHGEVFRRRLQVNSERVKNGLRSAGVPLPDHPGPIVTLLPLSTTARGHLYRSLIRAEIFPPFLQYPGGPAAGCFRFVISSEHTAKQLNLLIEVIQKFLSRFGSGAVSPR
jgi:8-amino-7-oxononanoate synthase